MLHRPPRMRRCRVGRVSGACLTRRASPAGSDGSRLGCVIDDGPQFKLLIHRVVKRFELDLAAWPRPPDRAGDDWGSYWRCRFEDALFRVGLGIRKLIESVKLSIEVQARLVEVASASLRSGRIPDVLNAHRVEEFYDLTAPRVTHVSLIRLCHSIVHSYVLIPRFTYSGVTGLRLEDFLLASDRDRRGRVYVVGWRHFVINVVHPVVNDDVRGVMSLRTGRGHEIRIPLSTSKLIDADRQRIIEAYKNLSKDHAMAVKNFSQKYREVWGRPHPDLS